MRRLVLFLLVPLLLVTASLAQARPLRLIADFASGAAKGTLAVSLEAVNFHDREDNGYHLEFTKRGISAVRARFQLNDFPEDAHLVLVNRSTILGQSMADVTVNGQTVVRNFDPRTRQFVKSDFPIGQYLRRGENRLEVVLSQESMKMYWLKAILIRLEEGQPGGGSSEDDLFAVERIQRLAQVFTDAMKSSSQRIEAGRKIGDLAHAGPMARDAAAAALGSVFDTMAGSSIQDVAIDGLAAVRGPRSARELGKLVNNAMAASSKRIKAISVLEAFQGFDERDAALEALAPLFTNGMSGQSVLNAAITTARAIGSETPVLAQILEPLINNAMAASSSRMAALDALTVLRDREAVAAAMRAIAPLFENGMTGQSVSNKALEVVELLGSMAPAEGVDAVAPLVRNAMASSSTRIRAIEVVGRIGRPVRRQAIRLLEELTMNGMCSSSVRRAASAAIEQLEY